MKLSAVIWYDDVEDERRCEFGFCEEGDPGGVMAGHAGLLMALQAEGVAIRFVISEDLDERFARWVRAIQYVDDASETFLADIFFEAFSLGFNDPRTSALSHIRSMDQDDGPNPEPEEDHVLVIAVTHTLKAYIHAEASPRVWKRVDALRMELFNKDPGGSFLIMILELTPMQQMSVHSMEAMGDSTHTLLTELIRIGFRAGLNARAQYDEYFDTSSKSPDALPEAN